MEHPLQDSIGKIVEIFIDEKETLPFVMDMISNEATFSDSIYNIGVIYQPTTAKFTAYS